MMSSMFQSEICLVVSQLRKNETLCSISSSFEQLF